MREPSGPAMRYGPQRSWHHGQKEIGVFKNKTINNKRFPNFNNNILYLFQINQMHFISPGQDEKKCFIFLRQENHHRGSPQKIQESNQIQFRNRTIQEIKKQKNIEGRTFEEYIHKGGLRWFKPTSGHLMSMSDSSATPEQTAELTT